MKKDKTPSLTMATNKEAAELKTTGLAIAAKAQEKDLAERAEVYRLAQEVAIQHVAIGLKYYDLCVYIRNAQIGPVVVREEMTKAGFNKARISEVITVASAPDETWNQYNAKSLGFKHTLEIVRNGKREIDLHVAKQIGDAPQAIDVASETSIDEPATPEEAKEKKDALQSSAIQAAKKLMSVASTLHWKSKSYDNGNGYKVTVQRYGKMQTGVAKQEPK